MSPLEVLCNVQRQKFIADGCGLS